MHTRTPTWNCSLGWSSSCRSRVSAPCSAEQQAVLPLPVGPTIISPKRTHMVSQIRTAFLRKPGACCRPRCSSTVLRLRSKSP